MEHPKWPRFFEATIEYDGLEWHGAIEVHLKSSYWYAHGHHQQASYDNVILHVVWEHDMAAVAANGVALPSLVLRDYVAPQVIARYQSGFSLNGLPFPVEAHLAPIPNCIGCSTVPVCLSPDWKTKPNAFFSCYSKLQTIGKLYAFNYWPVILG